MSDTVDERVTRAREYLRVAQQRDILRQLPSELMRECAESRRQLAALLAVIAERHDDAVTADLTESRQLAEVRRLLADFDWEFQDRQYALEAIERIVTGGEA
jgi:phosphoglycerate-specific signal transduction histidine kinase